MNARVAFVAYWIVFALILFVIIPVGTFYVPTMVEGWRVQGLKEAPFGWQLVVDLSDFFIHRWYIWLPLYMVLGIWLKSMASQRKS